MKDKIGLEEHFAIDETLERRWGKKIRIRGHYRDPLASSKERSVSASGIRWIVLALVVTVPWAERPWALPILLRLYRTKKECRRHRSAYRKKTELAKEMLDVLLGCSKVKIRTEEDPARLRPSDVPILWADPTKFRAATGWEPRIPFEQTLRDVLDYWRERVAAEGGRPARAGV